MRGAVLVAIAAAIGNMLQGWDNATIAGSLLYIKKEFNLQSEPTIEGLIVATSLIGATIITTFSGPVSDSLGRRPMLIMSSILYFISGLVMLWSPNVYFLLLARLLNGFGIGLAVTLIPVYISETAPPEIRGLLNTLPQFTGSAGMFLSYCMVFSMSLKESPNWRLMLGVLSVPSLGYFVLTTIFLPESPRWLVSKGRMMEAKMVLQRLRGVEDVSGEMALLVEGLGVGVEASIEDYIIAPANELENDHDNVFEQSQVKLLHNNEDGSMLIARPAPSSSSTVHHQSTLGQTSRQGSMVDPMVNLFGSIHEKLPGMGSMIFPTLGSMFIKDEEQQWEDDNYDQNVESNTSGVESDDNNPNSPLLQRQNTDGDKDGFIPMSHGSMFSMRQQSNLFGNELGEGANGIDIGGGWQLAYVRSEGKETGLKRIYLHQENGGNVSRRGSVVSIAEEDLGGFGHAAALVSCSVLHMEDLTGDEMVKPPEAITKRSNWAELFEPGVKHALIVGVGIQMLQQFSGINGVLYYTPQILEQAGVGVLLSNLGIGSDSASLLISALTTLLMLPSIGVAMRLMDIAGRRWLLLSTLPVLLLSLVVLVFGSIIDMGSVMNAVISTVSVVVYFCCFVMGFGPIPNILCAEIFPTRVRGLCIAICALTFWICDIIVTYSLPVMLSSIGLPGVFGIYAVVCSISWVFVYMKVPETKGMPLEVITEFFAVGAKQAASADVSNN
ncbi:monosaccharide-sensing protein 2-like [Impatiens glandulifera]|uniref:monosaccharide-sensing protein 2-like n=1 Tax=Impatiens glandulifera TaxID=253017 RepID=UPI001FB132F4|nr:monosaccharide-sensing protein 2-like [Impatiens glandulifera]